MKLRNLGNTGLRVSELGLGAWAPVEFNGSALASRNAKPVLAAEAGSLPTEILNTLACHGWSRNFYLTVL